MAHHSPFRSPPPRIAIPNPTTSEQPFRSPKDSDRDEVSDFEDTQQVVHQESTSSSSPNEQSTQGARTSTGDAHAEHGLPSASNIDIPGQRHEFDRRRNKRNSFIQSNINVNRRLPRQDDFPPSVSLEILQPGTGDPSVSRDFLQPVTGDQIKKVIIVLHNIAGTERTLENFSRILQGHYPECAFLLIRGLEAVHIGNSGYHWADPGGPEDGTTFDVVCSVLLLDVVKRSLIAKCGFSARDIIILGHGQGGMAALAATAAWETVEFAGVVSIGGPMPECACLSNGTKAKTPALALRGIEGDINPAALKRLQENFCHVTHDLPLTSQETKPESSEEMTMPLEPLLSFFAHRLRQEEWTKQTILSLGEQPKILIPTALAD